MGSPASESGNEQVSLTVESDPFAMGGEATIHHASLNGRAVVLRVTSSFLHAEETEVEDRITELKSILDLCNGSSFLLGTLGFVDNDPTCLKSVHELFTRPLDDQLNEGALTYVETVRVCDSVVRAVAFLHSNGILHYDLKPSNLLLRYQSPKSKTFAAVVLTDMGFAFFKESTLRPNRTENPFGSPGYLLTRDPEQEESWDVGAMGLTLWCTIHACDHAYTRRQADFYEEHDLIRMPTSLLPQTESSYPAGSLIHFATTLIKKSRRGRPHTGQEALRLWEALAPARKLIRALYAGNTLTESTLRDRRWTKGTLNRERACIRKGVYASYWKMQTATHKIVVRSHEGDIVTIPVKVVDGKLSHDGCEFESIQSLFKQVLHPATSSGRVRESDGD